MTVQDWSSKYETVSIVTTPTQPQLNSKVGFDMKIPGTLLKVTRDIEAVYTITKSETMTLRMKMTESKE